MPGQSARGVWRLTGDEAFFAGHFPGRPTLPGVLMVEAIAQLGAVAVLTDERFAGKLPLFGGLDRRGSAARSCRATRSSSRSSWAGCRHAPARAAARRRVGGEVACEAELLFVLVDADRLSRTRSSGPPTRRARKCSASGPTGYAVPITRQPLWPPKPKEFDSVGPGSHGARLAVDEVDRAGRGRPSRSPRSAG